MDHTPNGGQDRDDEDRVVSRRVQRPTRAEPGDEGTYRAADSEGSAHEEEPERAEPDAGGTAEIAATEVSEAADSEPSRSE